MASGQASRPVTMASAAHHALHIPPGQQPVAERTAECVARPEAVDHVDRHGRYRDRCGPIVRENALGPCLTTARPTPNSCGACAAARGSRRHFGLDLVQIADGHAHVGQRLLHPVPRLLP
jgi:hypothetical protein